MVRRAQVLVHNQSAGILEETADGTYLFSYDASYVEGGLPPVSLTLPLRKEPYRANVLFPFFDGLIPEGWLLDLTVNNWKLDAKDRMGLLLSACRDCIGAVSIEEIAAVKSSSKPSGKKG